MEDRARRSTRGENLAFRTSVSDLGTVLLMFIFVTQIYGIKGAKGALVGQAGAA